MSSPFAACGSDDDDSAADTTGGAAIDATAADGSDGTADSAAFPVTIEHKYGEMTIDAPPERVVSVGFADQDPLLALGIVPVGIRDWYGDQPFATWPWATPALGDAEPTVLPSTELNFEQIRSLDPDLIVGVSSGMTEEEYATLSAIAPTLPQSAEFIDYGVPWQEATRVIGEATGRLAEAEALIADVEGQLQAAADAHPEWDGLEAAVGYVLSETEIGAYASADPRPRLMAELGFVTPAEFDELAGDLFYSSFSFEEMGRLDRDVLVWISGDPAINDQIRANPLREQLAAVDRRAGALPGSAAGGSVLVLQLPQHPVSAGDVGPPARGRRPTATRRRRCRSAPD